MQVTGSTAKAAERALKGRLDDRHQVQPTNGYVTPDSLFTALVTFWLDDIDATATVTARRELIFAMGMGMNMGGGMGGDTGSGMGRGMEGMMSATIQVFDAIRVDTTVRFDSVEDWLLTNASPLDHPVHLHVRPMQIIEQSGQPRTL